MMALTTSEERAERRKQEAEAWAKDVRERAEAYVDDVLSGRIKAPRKVIKACKRHRRDMAHAAAGWKYQMDWERASRPIRFIEEFLKPGKGAYSTMRLMGWQVFGLASMYGWINVETGLRRYREALWEVGRGNGKTTIAAGTSGYAVTKDGENGAEVALLANSHDQAGIAFREVKTQLTSSPVLRKRIRPTVGGLYHDASNSWIRRMSSQARRKDGYSISFALFDEIHEYTGYELINAVKRSHNKRRQPMDFYATTKGQVLDGPLMDYHRIFTDAMEDGLVDPEVADTLFCLIYELDDDDDIEDTSNWIKANPSLGVLLKLEDLERDWKRCKLVPQERADFINKQLNLFTQMEDGAWTSIDVINACDGVINEADLAGLPCYAGYDLSTCDDLTAVCLLYPLPDGRVYVGIHSWVTRDYIEKVDDKTPFYQWQLMGECDIVDGGIIPKDVVFDYLVERRKAGEDIRVIGYDPANAVRLNMELQNEDFQTHVVRQGALTLNDPMHEILQDYMLNNRLVFNKSPMVRWFLHNVRLRRDPRKDQVTNVWMPTKRRRKLKIDGFMAMLDAWVVWTLDGFKPEASEPEMITYFLTDEE